MVLGTQKRFLAGPAASVAIPAIRQSPVRKERALKAGTRVRIDAPGYSFHGDIGTTKFGSAPQGVVYVMRDKQVILMGVPTAVCSDQVARLRNQTPNPAHAAILS